MASNSAIITLEQTLQLRLHFTFQMTVAPWLNIHNYILYLLFFFSSSSLPCWRCNWLSMAVALLPKTRTSQCTSHTHTYTQTLLKVTVSNSCTVVCIGSHVPTSSSCLCWQRRLRTAYCSRAQLFSNFRTSGLPLAHTRTTKTRPGYRIWASNLFPST